MKKTLSLLLVAMLLFLSGAALAEVVPLREKSDKFDVTIALPEGATIQSTDGGGEFDRVTVVCNGLASVTVSIAPSELYEERNMADLSEEEVAQLKEIAGEQYENPEFNTEITPSNNQYLHLCSNEEDDIDSIFTLYKGYFVQLNQFHDDFSTLTDADQQFLLDVLHGIEFEEVK